MRYEYAYIQINNEYIHHIITGFSTCTTRSTRACGFRVACGAGACSDPGNGGAVKVCYTMLQVHIIITYVCIHVITYIYIHTYIYSNIYIYIYLFIFKYNTYIIYNLYLYINICIYMFIIYIYTCRPVLAILVPLILQIKPLLTFRVGITHNGYRCPCWFQPNSKLN